MLDIRWKQRFQNFSNAFVMFDEAVKLAKSRPLSNLEKQGLIQSFEFTHELAWNVLKDYLDYQGINGLVGSRDSSREAFQKGLISDGEAWMEMIKSRNATTHTYNKKTADEILNKIQTLYYQAFVNFKIRFEELLKK